MSEINLLAIERENHPIVKIEGSNHLKLIFGRDYVERYACQSSSKFKTKVGVML